ncbi:Cytochrome c oxidase assembly protein COX15 [Candida viswanathii]|uniref:Cytochrome c oxidase assembly protein COX15 n=1 Tax=Candida viswanathii TaxID=5486 RepID=A0A367XX45_9ASCO|nr:Cytochrome c oxidase assembly protein COX15 [Candida viswanathii]
MLPTSKLVPLLKFSRIFNNLSKRKYTTIAPTANSNIAKTEFSVAYWLLGTSGLVFGIVVLGGLTRLTESGLSITEWKPVTVQNSPEFKQLNSHITLDEFKFIFSMEWGHRLVGRCIGAFFILPALYFYTPQIQATVSQYRLTTHLGAAFLMYLGVLWTAFEILNENKLVAEKILSQLNNPALKKTRNIGTALLALTFVTAMSGGMVAGLDAGLIYNTFPHMGDDWIPSQGELMDPVYARREDKSDLWWRNILENPTTVQLVHRIFATTTLFSVLAAHMYVNRNKAIVPAPAKRMMHAMMGVVTLQVALGITTLIYLVPIPLAAMHQAGALALLTAALAFSAKLKRPRPQFMQYINSSMKNQLLKARV